MIGRRNLMFGCFGALLGLVGLKASPKERCRVFRLTGAESKPGKGVTEHWLEITPQEVRAGDRVICIGVTDGELWRLDSFTDKYGWEPCPDGTEYGQSYPTKVCDFLKQMAEKAKEVHDERTPCHGTSHPV